MKYIKFLFYLLFSTNFVFAEQTEHNVINCEIYDMNKQLIRRVPGKMCIFLDNGGFISAQKENLVYYDNLRNEVWSQKIYPHHQMNLSIDQNSILVLGSQTQKMKGPKKTEKVRFDVLYILNLDGKILQTFDFYKNKNQFNKLQWLNAEKRKHSQIGAKELYSGVDWELTHANSFYEIPENTISATLPAFQKGNYIINDISLMLVFILSSDLKKILWQSTLLPEVWTMLHDVQVKPDSNLLVLYDNGTPERPQTRLVEFDVLQDKIHWQFPSVLTSTFYSKKMGGVQVLKNGHFLYNDITDIPVAHEIDRQGKMIWSLTPRFQYASKTKMEPFQQIKRFDLSPFLKKHRGL